jgi:hypothetical protein
VPLYTDRVEAFFVVVSACVLLGVGIWALAAMRHLFTLTQPDSTQRRPGDD